MKKPIRDSQEKNAAAVALGRLRAAQMTKAERAAAGRVGGANSRKNMSAKRKQEIARKAAQARWAKKRAEVDNNRDTD